MLSSPQKGNSVSIPLGSYAPCVPDGTDVRFVTDENQLGNALKARLSDLDVANNKAYIGLETSSLLVTQMVRSLYFREDIQV